MSLRRLYLAFAIIGTALLFNGCSKSADSENITLYDKPLDVIQEHLTGTWREVYIEGGFVGGTYPISDLTYYTITPDKIIIQRNGTDIVNAPIVWKQWSGGRSRFLLTFNTYEHFSAVEIKDGVLQLSDDNDDGYQYFFVRVK